MKVVIFAGGLSSRLWPVAREGVPKAFHKILRDKTPLEESYGGIRAIFNPKDIFISAGMKDKKYIQSLAPDIPDENLILEPKVVDSGPAVAYAMLRIKQKFPREPVLIRWANSIIKDIDAFKDILHQADVAFKDKATDLIFVGTPLLYPNPNIGHIKCVGPKEDLTKHIELFSFGGFVEKPKLKLAKSYFESGEYVGNPGVYITRPEYMLEQLKNINPMLFNRFLRIEAALGTELEKEVIGREFDPIEKISVDYLFWENLDLSNTKVIVGEFGWRYISAWGELKKALQVNPKDNVTKGLVKAIKSENNLLYNLSDGKIVAVAGIEGLVVVNTDDAVLVTTVEKSALVRKLKKEIKESEDLKSFG